jgi:hypothetical protein
VPSEEPGADKRQSTHRVASQLDVTILAPSLTVGLLLGAEGSLSRELHLCTSFHAELVIFLIDGVSTVSKSAAASVTPAKIPNARVNTSGVPATNNCVVRPAM